MVQEEEISANDRPKKTRRRGACKLCRQKKVRCNGDHPCKLCKRHDVDCIYEIAGLESSGRRLRTPSEPTLPHSPGRISRPRHQRVSASLQNNISHLTQEGEDNNWFLNLVSAPADFQTTCPADLTTKEFFNGSQLTAQEVSEQELQHHEVRDDFGFQSYADGDDAFLFLSDLSGTDPSTSNARIMNMNLVNTSPKQTAHQNDDKGFTRTETLNLLSPSRANWATSSRLKYKRVLFAALRKNASSGTDRVPYNPCTATLVSKLAECGIDTSKRQTVIRTMVNLLSQDYQMGLPAAWGFDFAENVGNSIDDTTLSLQKLVTRCFDEYWGVKLYLDQAEVLGVVEQYHNALDLPSYVIDRYLISTLAAWGSFLDPDQQPHVFCERMAVVLELEHNVLMEHDSLAKFFAMVASLQLAFKTGLNHLSNLLATAVSIIRSLNLHSEAALRNLCPRHQNILHAKCACWVVFCIDEAYAMRWRTFPVGVLLHPRLWRRTGTKRINTQTCLQIFPESIITYEPPLLMEAKNAASVNEVNDWLQVQCRYARICAEINRNLLSADSIPESTTPLNLAIKLRDWYDSVKEGQFPDTSTASTLYSRQVTVCVLYQYHEANLAILDISKASLTLTLSGPLGSKELSLTVLSSVKEIFAASHKIEDVLWDRSLLYVPTLGLCKLAVEYLQTPLISFRDARALFAVVHGLFGRLSSTLPTERFFDQVTELIDTVMMFHEQVC